MRQLIFMLLISVTACNEQIEKTDSKNERTAKSEFHLTDSTYVILDYKSDWHWIFENAKQTDISKNDLAEIEELIQKAVMENNDQQRKNLDDHNKKYPDIQWTETGFELETKGFKRQYVPVINENGQKEVWINFFCDDWGKENWKSDILIVKDGGNCYFTLKVNLETKIYSELRINGQA